jgi:hypothetical protein
MNSELKILLVLAGVFAIAYLINSYSCENFGDALSSMGGNKAPVNHVEEFADTSDDKDDSFSGTVSSDETSSDSNPSEKFSDIITKEESMDNVKDKLKSKNSAPEGSYAPSSYAGNNRKQNNNPDIDKYFTDNDQTLKGGFLSNDNYSGKDETDDKYASYNSGPKKMMTDEDIFKSDNYLAKETNQSWFEVPPEPISIKNRHLINISRPIGVNTIGNSLRNPSYDLRGSPPNPKFVVSPWMQSTIEPDLNIKGLC